jgi:hypothetical protein
MRQKIDPNKWLAITRMGDASGMSPRPEFDRKGIATVRVPQSRCAANWQEEMQT